MGHRFQDSFYSLEKFPVCLWGYVAIGATGAPTITSNKSLGITSIARTGSGAYTITLKKKYHSVLFANVTFIDSDSGIAKIEVVEDDVDGSTPVVKIVCISDAGSAADPAQNAIMLLKLELRNSQVTA